MNIYSTIEKKRPVADHSIEQYLMTIESLKIQCKLLEPYLINKKILFIGDDDHFSLIISNRIHSYRKVLEIDERVIKSQKNISDEFKIQNHSISKYNATELLPNKFHKQYNAFVINPPYGSKNNGYGSLVWISRALAGSKPQSIGVITLPILFSKPWSILNIQIIQKFLLKNNCTILDIHKDIHSYEGLPEKDGGMKSSNIIVLYLGDAKHLISEVVHNIYR